MPVWKKNKSNNKVFRFNIDSNNNKKPVNKLRKLYKSKKMSKFKKFLKIENLLKNNITKGSSFLILNSKIKFHC